MYSSMSAKLCTRMLSGLLKLMRLMAASFCVASELPRSHTIAGNESVGTMPTCNHNSSKMFASTENHQTGKSAN